MSDDRVRELERAAGAGDQDALAMLKRERERAGRCPDCGCPHAKPDTTSCRERGFLRLLREIKSATSHATLRGALWEAEAAIEGRLVTVEQNEELAEALDDADAWLRRAEALPEGQRRALGVLIDMRAGTPGVMPPGVTPEQVAGLQRLLARRMPRWPEPHARGTRARTCRACRAELAAQNDAEPPAWREQARLAIRFALEADPCRARAPATIAAARPWFTKAAGRYPDRCWQEERQKALAALQNQARPTERAAANGDNAATSEFTGKTSEGPVRTRPARG